ncbi:hypothetical protein Oweho_0006 [Owenweeksia hongkongensis DSM 17368]|uniref:SMODS and SLOG-associating 2TM effector domain-containing protein n=1 Tax=Owenweeksia hongkongensis (strain DSM 17368 / CIP 108786 / JCM 12287 / NRRL B-23963 / UST20020801) TaxID=926562 RepID=G8R522_OWEHD|nr:hypothetical protein [Owenweeksia hongkongensis]AEV31033.1 hypothetical protein Oweho_0006 [Owenweeksia hongkongensis DSM 17368]
MGNNNIQLSQRAPVNEIVGLLQTHNESELDLLRQRYPGFLEILKPGLPMGDNENQLDTEKELEMRATVCEAGLNLVFEKAGNLLPLLKGRLKKLNGVQFISQILVLLSGTTILAYFKEDHEKIVSMIVGFFTLSAGILSLYVQRKSGTIISESGGITKVYNELTDYQLKAEIYLNELKILREINWSKPNEQVMQIITEANLISSEMNRIIIKY